jgi:hypothetical protein
MQPIVPNKYPGELQLTLREPMKFREKFGGFRRKTRKLLKNLLVIY